MTQPMGRIENNRAEENEKKNQDLENYFANTIISQLFIDGKLILKKFTPPARKQFSLTDEDMHRDIHHVKKISRYPGLIENIEEVIRTGELLEKEVQTTNGEWYQLNILPYFRENRTNGVIVTFVDITKRIRAIGELEKLNSEYHTRVNALSHDIRQPLSAIALLSDALLNAYHKQNTPQFIKYIETLKSSSNAMRELVKDFIVISEEQPELEGEQGRTNIENR